MGDSRPGSGQSQPQKATRSHGFASSRHREPAAASDSPFSRLVERLEPGSDVPGMDELDRVLDALRRLLVRELKRRGLWLCSPSLLGIFGATGWVGGPSGEAGALEELLYDCYAFIFVERLRSLKNQLSDKPELDGLVVLNVRHFLFDRQRRHDPLGYRIYQVLLAAVRRLIANGELLVGDGEIGVHNSTVLRFVKGDLDAAAAPVSELEALAAVWAGELLPEVATARGVTARRLQERLASRLASLPAGGVEAVRFKDLIDVLKREARARWAALLVAEEPPSLTPAAHLEQRQRYEELTACVERRIDGLQSRPKERADLRRLWRFFQSQSAGDQEQSGRLSNRGLSRELSISRDRVPRLVEMLRQLVAECRRDGAARMFHAESADAGDGGE